MSHVVIDPMTPFGPELENPARHDTHWALRINLDNN